MQIDRNQSGRAQGPPLRPSRNRFAVAIAMLLGLAQLTAPPARPQDPRPGVFGESLDVRVVNVEVVVTDRKGVRVSGLGRDDFALEVDGEPATVDYFAEVEGGRVEEPAPAATATAPPAVVPGQPLGVSWLLFVDDFFSIQRDRNKVLQAVAAQVGRLGPADRMAVVAWDGRRLTMLSSWTGSVPALQRALKAAEERPALGLQRTAERRSLIEDRRLRQRFGTPSLSGSDASHLDPDERQYTDQLAGQVQRSVGAAAATLRAFAAPPGRKAMLLLSGGWPWQPVEDAVPDPLRLITERTLGAEALFRPLSDVANLLGYTLYPVDVPGMSQRIVDAADPSPPTAGSELAESRQEQNLHLSLGWLAESTGGRAFLNSARLAVLEEAVTDTRTFYWLGFTPKRAGDDRPHRVRVTVKRPGLEVRSRQGFLDASRTAEVSMAVESALLFGNPASASPLGLVLGRPEKSRGRTMRVPITVRVPLDQLTPLPGADGPAVTLELRVAAQDAEGNTAAIPVVPLQMKLPPDVRPGALGTYQTSLMLRRTAHDLVVALYEPVSGKVFSATARIAP